MSAVITAPFGQPVDVHAAACANRAFARAILLDYSRTSAQQFARIAKRECGPDESPQHCALRIVIPKAATFAGNPGGAP